ncbi:MAG TPA: TonB-dependent receptor, partial [Bryobacterales bacterium]|nr:TonB-dependent receptor [Bryobacterales bacterium]
PNLPGNANNFFSNQTERIRNDQSNFRVDEKLSDRDSMFARFSFSQDLNLLPAPLPPPANDPSQVFPRTRQLALSETHLVSSNKVNEFRFGFTRSFVNQDISGPRLFEQYGILGTPAAGRVRGLPTFAVSGLATIGTAAPGGQLIPATGSGNLPITKASNVSQFLDNFSIVSGRHTIKTGADIQFVQYNVNTTLNARPAFTFNGTFTQDPQSRPRTGDPLADFLLGYMSNTNVSTPGVSGLRQRIFQGYIQDDWKVSRKLTLNLGLRYELPKPFFEVNGRQSNLIFEPGSPKYLQLVQAKDAASVGLGAALINPDYNNFAPRLGLAYALTPKTILRAAGGVFYGRDENIGVDARLVNNPPFFVRVTYPADQIHPAAGPHGELLLLQNGIPPDTLDPTNAVNPQVRAWPRQSPTPYVMQWNFDIQRELPGNIVWETAYTGSGARKLYFLLNRNTPLPGPGPIDPRRSFQGYGDINNYGPFVRSSYNALLVKAEKRFSRGMSFLASYTYGHSIDNGRNNNDNRDPGPENPRCLDCDRASSNFDVTHRFVASYLWAPPFRSPLLRGWQLSGITAMQSGLPYSVTLNVDNTNSLAAARPDRLHDGSLSSGQRSIQSWFDLSAFATPAGYAFGNSGRNILRGPGRVNFDAALARTFSLRERWKLEFRGEFFNLFNTPQFDLPNSTLGVPAAGQINGTITPMRQIQFGLRVEF